MFLLEPFTFDSETSSKFSQFTIDAGHVVSQSTPRIQMVSNITHNSMNSTTDTNDATDKNGRPLNAFETIFASCNVRFAILLAPDDHKTVTVSQAERAIHKSLKRHKIAFLQLHKQQQDSSSDERWFLQQEQTEQPFVKLQTFSIVPEAEKGHWWTLKHFLDRPDIPAEGPMHMHVINYRDTPGDSFTAKTLARAVMLDGNHAMVDGRSLVGLATDIAHNLHHDDHENEEDDTLEESMASPLGPLIDWRDLLNDPSLEERPQWNANPSYLAPTESILNIADDLSPMPSPHDNDPNANSFSYIVSGELMQKWKMVVGAEKQQSGASISITAVIVEMIMHSLSQEEGSAGKHLSVSVLVDLRPFLLSSEDEHHDLPQAISTVTLSLPADEFNGTSTGVVEEHLSRAKMLTSQLKDRIARGEHIRCARALTNGKFEEAAPPATIELSNLGVVDMPKGVQMLVGQRFDDYDGVSCMAHSEKESGELKFEVGLGKNMSYGRVESIFERVIESMDILLRSDSTQE